MDEQKDFVGKGGFIWFIGFVEDEYNEKPIIKVLISWK